MKFNLTMKESSMCFCIITSHELTTSDFGNFAFKPLNITLISVHRFLPHKPKPFVRHFVAMRLIGIGISFKVYGYTSMFSFSLFNVTKRNRVSTRQKTNKRAFAHSEDSDQTEHLPQQFFKRTANTQIRLGSCAGLFEFSLGAHVTFLILSFRGSYYLVSVCCFPWQQNPSKTGVEIASC